MHMEIYAFHSACELTADQKELDSDNEFFTYYEKKWTIGAKLHGLQQLKLNIKEKADWRRTKSRQWKQNDTWMVTANLRNKVKLVANDKARFGYIDDLGATDDESKVLFSTVAIFLAWLVRPTKRIIAEIQ